MIRFMVFLLVDFAGGTFPGELIFAFATIRNVLSTIEATLRPSRVRALTEFPQEGQTPPMHYLALNMRRETLAAVDSPAHRSSRARIKPAIPLEVHA
jgi:hypothetical protein